MDDDIRAPDEPIRERLLPSNSYPNHTYESEDDLLRRALEESQTMFELEERELLETLIKESNIVAEQEDDIELQHAIILSKQLQEERDLRSRHVAAFKSRFTQFMRIDRANTEFYSDMIQYAEKYESGEVTSVSIGEEYYAKFCRTLDTLRITQEEKSKLLEIIIQ